MAAPWFDPVPLQTLAPRGGRAEEGDRVGVRSGCRRRRVGGTFPLGNRPLAGTRRSLGLAHRSLARGTSPEETLRSSALDSRRRKVGLNRATHAGHSDESNSNPKLP